ncbi:hypothetical protein QLX08_009355 [Tetragonisca angustula]|uniref:Uncharacterized protein n=1 Tax=Tetragonisca angustula TaxID=166442 RepID=A0AAW0ZIY4_9HYME
MWETTSLWQNAPLRKEYRRALSWDCCYGTGYDPVLRAVVSDGSPGVCGRHFNYHGWKHLDAYPRGDGGRGNGGN